MGSVGIPESNAILRYLASVYKPELYPSEANARAVVDAALDWNVTNFYPHEVYGMGYMYVGYKDMDEAVLKANEKKMLEQTLPYLEAKLSKQKFLGGDSLTSDR